MNYYALYGFLSFILVIAVIFIVHGYLNFFTVSIAIVSCIIMAVLRFMRHFSTVSSGFWHSVDETNSRKKVLRLAAMYLSPYNSIWNNLKLSNQHCTLLLGKDGDTVTVMEKKTAPYRIFKTIIPKKGTVWNIFDRLCLHFNTGTTYDILTNYCRMYNLTISECTVQGDSSASKEPSKIKVQTEKSLNTGKNDIKPDIRTDVNNCSEIELTTLPGISIVISKKIIKKREEIGGFKDTDEFFNYIKFKPHMEKQLRELVCTNKMRGSLKIQKYSERNLDL